MDYLKVLAGIHYVPIVGTNISHYVHHGQLSNLYFLRFGTPNSPSEASSNVVRFTGYTSLAPGVAVRKEGHVILGEVTLGSLTSGEVIPEEAIDVLFQVLRRMDEVEESKAVETEDEGKKESENQDEGKEETENQGEGKEESEKGGRKRGKEEADANDAKRVKREGK